MVTFEDSFKCIYLSSLLPKSAGMANKDQNAIVKVSFKLLLFFCKQSEDHIYDGVM